MTKQFIAEVIQKSTGVTGVAAREAAGEVIDAIVNEIKTSGSYNLTGFGTFRLVETKARPGFNPRTGEKVKIKAGKTVRFKASQTLKEVMRGRGKGKLTRRTARA